MRPAPPNERRVRRPAHAGATPTAAVLAAVVTATVHVHPAGAQPAAAAEARALAERVARAGDGTVRFAFATRPGVCGDGGRGFTWVRGDDTSHVGRRDDDARWTWRCVPGPARVTLAVRGGAAQTLRLTVGGPAPNNSAPATDLGVVGAPAAAAYLLDLAAHPTAPPSDDAVLAAVVADADPVWPGLLQLARADRAPAAARRAGTFWASQFACDAARATRARGGPLAPADTADREARKQVVFALSQRRGDERTAPLTRAARADRDPAVRCAALFWLGQQPGARGGEDAGVLALYQAVLRER